MLFNRRQGIVLTAALVVVLFIFTGRILAADLTSVSVMSDSLVPGQETRYTIKFSIDRDLDLSKGTMLTVSLPSGFSIVHNDILAADPGCTLARMEYKNPADRNFAVIRGAVDVKREGDGVQFSFMPPLGQLVIPADTNLYLVIPGIVNPSTASTTALKLIIHHAGGEDCQGTGEFTLGLAPARVPEHVRLVEASSYMVRLAWDPVPGVTRYRVVFSIQPEGQYISALDFTRDPFPGEEWVLTETNHSFSGRGNGGLKPGGTYYFKVLAGNEAGFGTGSTVLRVTLPEVRLLNSQPEGQATTVVVAQALVAKLDQPVKIADPDAIAVYEKNSERKVRKVHAVVDETNSSRVLISAELQPGKDYLVVFYEGALESTVQPKVVNNNFGWTVAVINGR